MTSHFLWASRTTPLHKQGQELRSEQTVTPIHEQRPFTYFCVLTIRKHLLKMRFERSGRGQEPSRGHKFSILENFLSPLGQLLVGACLPQTLPDKSKGALSAPMLFLSLLLFQFKLTLLFCFALFTAKCFSHQIVFFSLHLQRLL